MHYEYFIGFLCKIKYIYTHLELAFSLFAVKHFGVGIGDC